jgi:hypothetical protein
MIHLRRAVVVVLTAALVATAVSCRDSQPTAILSAPAARHVVPSRDAGEDDAPQLVACSAHGTLTESAMVGPHGAVISVGSDHLVIPAGAVEDSTLITATIPADTLADIEFEPQGLQFGKPAILTLNTAGCDVGRELPRHVVYLDAAGQVLETLEASPASGGHGVVTQIHHFSSYAVAF